MVIVDKLNFQSGFLRHQTEPATAHGDRELKYDVKNGTFQLSTTSFAEIRCDMDFGLYPFDVQECPFAVYLRKNLTYQGKVALCMK